MNSGNGTTAEKKAEPQPGTPASAGAAVARMAPSPAAPTATAKPVGTARPAPASRLGKVTKGRMKIGLRHTYYGPEGVGKTTLAAGADAPIWLDIEDGSSLLNVARYKFRDDDDGHVPRSYAEVVAAVEDLTVNPHDYKTVVVDGLERLESLIWAHMIARDKGKVKESLDNIEDYGYAKGYNIAVDDWRSFLSKLDKIRFSRGVTVILLAHSLVRTFKNPSGEDYERYSLAVNEKAAAFIKSWSDIVGFCHFDEGGGKAPGAKRVKGWSTGKRLIELSRTAAYDAKGRGGMPAQLDLDALNPWSLMEQAIAASDGIGVPELQTMIAAEIDRIGDPELATRVADAVAKAVAVNNAESLNRYLQELRRRESQQPTAA